MTLVIAQHCGLAPFGWVGVWLFYVISGFVISRNFDADRGRPLAAQYKDFISRRFYRIVPALILYIAVNVLVMLAAERYIGLRDIPFLLTFTYNWQMIFQYWPTPNGWPSFGHLWTLSVEEQFYIAFPLLFLFLPRKSFLVLAGLLIAAGPVLRGLYASFLIGFDQAKDPNWTAFAIYAGSFSQFDAFLAGALIGTCEAQLRARPQWCRALLVTAAIVAVTYAGVYVVVNHALGAGGTEALRNIFSGTLFGQSREIFVYSAVDIACAAILVSTLRDGRLTRGLGTPYLALIGRISYSGYLYHALILWLLAVLVMPASFKMLPVPERIAWFLLAFLLTVGIASISFFWFERPLMSWARRRRQDARPALMTAHPITPAA